MARPHADGGDGAVAADGAAAQGRHIVGRGLVAEFGEVEQGDRPPGDFGRGSSTHDITLTTKRESMRQTLAL